MFRSYFDVGANSNPCGGMNGSFQFGQGFGTNNHNFDAVGFAAQSSQGGLPTLGGGLNYNNNGHGLSIHHSTIPGVSSTNTFGGKVNVFDDGDKKVNINGLKSHTELQVKGYDCKAANIEIQQKNGNSASIGMTTVPQFNHKSVDANAKLNMWKSTDGKTSVDLNTGVSKNIGQYEHGKTNLVSGIGLTHRF